MVIDISAKYLTEHGFLKTAVKSRQIGPDLGVPRRELVVDTILWWMESFRMSEKSQDLGMMPPGIKIQGAGGKLRHLRWKIKPVQRSRVKQVEAMQ